MRTILLGIAAGAFGFSGVAFAQDPPNPFARSPVAGVTTNAFVTPVEDMVGRTLVDGAGRPLGIVDDVLLDPDGQARHLVIDRGGFPGDGPARVAIPLGDVRMRSDSLDLHIAGLGADDLSRLPAFESGDGVTSLNRRDTGAGTPDPREDLTRR
ncbi:MAG TPA: PRC-barrel domain-containing protein [Azospirillum sp.]|nr:PRC-barrel domain-containing protein [Azospirillum sp.]